MRQDTGGVVVSSSGRECSRRWCAAEGGRQAPSCECCGESVSYLVLGACQREDQVDRGRGRAVAGQERERQCSSIICRVHFRFLQPSFYHGIIFLMFSNDFTVLLQLMFTEAARGGYFSKHHRDMLRHLRIKNTLQLSCSPAFH